MVTVRLLFERSTSTSFALTVAVDEINPVNVGRTVMVTVAIPLMGSMPILAMTALPA